MYVIEIVHEDIEFISFSYIVHNITQNIVNLDCGRYVWQHSIVLLIYNQWIINLLITRLNTHGYIYILCLRMLTARSSIIVLEKINHYNNLLWSRINDLYIIDTRLKTI